MPLTYYWILTAIGLAKKAAMEAGGPHVSPAVFVVGDGNGVYSEPNAGQVALVHEVWRGPVNRVYVHKLDPTLVVVEALIPEADGGFFIREAGIIDQDGDLIAVGKYPLVEKPAPGSGAAREEYVRGGLRVSNGGDLVLQIDPSLVMATKEDLDSLTVKVDGLLQKIFPVGSLYHNMSNPANPADILGFGVWAPISGRMILGAGGGHAAGDTGGAETHQLTIAEMPSHDHDIDFTNRTSTGTNGGGRIASGGEGLEYIAGFKTGSTGGGQPHPNMPPYVVGYIWKRTA